MKYKAITSFAHAGAHVESGSEVEITDKHDAALLRGLGRIASVEITPEPPVVETAEAAPAPERAEAPSAKRKK